MVLIYQSSLLSGWVGSNDSKYWLHNKYCPSHPTYVTARPPPDIHLHYMCVQFLPSRANHQPPLEYSEIWRFLCKSNPILHVVRLAIFCRIPQSLTLLVVLVFIEFANLQSKIHDHLRISRDLIDSVLLCFKYPSLLYTLSETRGELVEILNSNSTFSTRERQNRNFWITDMTDFLNES